ncbi:MAG TPA: 16S rRNA processing protein RimM [Candidatus Pullichristensenella avicola]|nr:16S rRNA processing protein RimM [Candidatus Pullichristensenella avicola]
MDKYLVIGEIVKPQGVRGEVKLRPITCDAGRFDDLTLAYLKRAEEYIPVRIAACRRAQDAVFIAFEGVADRNAAETLRGELLYIDREHAVKLDEDSNFLCDLIGLRGVDDEGNDWGTLRDVLQPGGNDVYVFEGPRGETLVPALKSVVKSVDLDRGEMVLAAARMREVAVFDED